MCLAVPGKITSITGEDPLSRTGRIDFGGILKEANLAYVPEAQVGDYVIVHVGFAISRVDEEEAQKVFEYLRQMEALAEEFEPGEGEHLKSSSAGGVSSANPDSKRGTA